MAKFISQKNAAADQGCHVRTLTRAAKRGELAIYNFQNRIHFRLDEFEAWQESRRNVPTSMPKRKADKEAENASSAP